MVLAGSSSLVQEMMAAAGNPTNLQSKLRSVFMDAVGQVFEVMVIQAHRMSR